MWITCFSLICIVLFLFANDFFQVCEAGLHISLGVGWRLFTYLENDCQDLDLRIALQKDEDLLDPAEQELVVQLRKAQNLEQEAEDLSEEAEHHQIVHDWYCAAAEPGADIEAADIEAPLDIQLAQLRKMIQDHIKSAALKVIQQYFLPMSVLSFFQLVCWKWLN